MRVFGFGQILKSDPRGFAARVFDRPLAEHVSACGRRNEAPVAREKKPLVPRVIEQVSVMRGLTVILFLNKKTSSNKSVAQF